MQITEVALVYQSEKAFLFCQLRSSVVMTVATTTWLVLDFVCDSLKHSEEYSHFL